MKFLLIVLVIVCLIILSALCWLSIKMLKQAQKDHQTSVESAKKDEKR